MSSRNRLPWYDTTLSYNPAIHRTKQALFHSAVVSDLNSSPLPPPHPELLKFFEPPKRVLKRAKGAADGCKEAFKIKTGAPSFPNPHPLFPSDFCPAVPKKVTRTRKDGHVPAMDDEEEVLLLDAMPRKATRSSQRTKPTTPPSQPSQSVIHTTNKEDASETESEGGPDGPEEETHLPPTPARSESPEIDPGKPSGRIVGTTFPLADFQKNIAKGDVVSKAVEDFAWAIREIVGRPFAARRTEEMITCMKTLRDTALKVRFLFHRGGFTINIRFEGGRDRRVERVSALLL